MAREAGRVAILGLGLIGGSVAAALKAGGAPLQIAGWAPGGDARAGREAGWLDVACASAAEAVRGADWVVLAAPVPAMPGLLREIAPALGPGARVTDCGSTKRSVIEAARRELGEAFGRFVPGHPIAGSERSGPAAARADLFRGRRWLLCPVDDAQAANAGDLERLLAPTGAVFSKMPASLHDRLFAEVSHWPHAVAFALSAAIAGSDLSDAALEHSGAGLRDTTRIAASSPELWAGILLDNRDAALESAARFERAMETVVAALRAGDREALVAIFEAASRWRGRLG